MINSFLIHFPGVLNGPDIRKLMKQKSFSKSLGPESLKAWEALKAVIKHALGKERSPNYETLVNEMIEAYRVIDVHMSLKIHLLHFHMDFFSRQVASESDEQGERYHQVALPFEIR